MYTDYFGFDSKPFNSRDPSGYYHNADFDAACATILQGILTRQGIMLLTGEAGLGKTLILRRCIAEADNIRFILLGNANLDFPNILNYLCDELELCGGESDAELQNQLLRDALATYANRGQPVALLIDDAHHLQISTLQRLWEFVETSAATVDQRLQLILVGLPDIEIKLHQPELSHLRESLKVQYRLERLSELETGLFIAHQLNTAGQAGENLLLPAVVERIVHYGQGVPRTIVKLCDTALLFASLQSEHTITPTMMDEAAQNCLFGNQAELLKPTADLEPSIASATNTPSPAAKTPRYPWSPRILVNSLALVAVAAAAIIWFWSPQLVLEDTKALLPNNLSQQDYLTDPPDAHSPIFIKSPTSATTSSAIPALNSTVSWTPTFESPPALPLEAATTLLTLDPVSITQLEIDSEIDNPISESDVNNEPSNASQPSSETTEQQASQVQTQSRITKPRKAAKSRKATRSRKAAKSGKATRSQTVAKSQTAVTTQKKAKAARTWKTTPRNPWKPPTPTGFNQK